MNPIPNDHGVAADAVLDLDLGVESREAASIIVDKVAAILRYAPTGDNHHNAAACPYCSPQHEKALGQVRVDERQRIEEGLLSDEAIDAIVCRRFSGRHRGTVYHGVRAAVIGDLEAALASLSSNSETEEVRNA